MQGNCLTVCKHLKYRDKYEKVPLTTENGVVFGYASENKGREWYCDKGSECFALFWKNNAKKRAEDAEKLECYEPEDFYKSLRGCIDIANEILEKIKDKEDETRTNA